MKQLRETLGWSMGLHAPYWDETGTFHLQLAVNGIAHSACGSPVMTSGQVESDPVGRGCRRCQSTPEALALAALGAPHVP